MIVLGVVALILGQAVESAAPPLEAPHNADRAVIEKVIRDNIGWALTKDRPLLESTLAHDERLFIFNPTPDATVGWQQFVKGFDFWMDPRFKATILDIRELRIDQSRSGDVAWWSCILDDLGEWDGRPIGWKDTRWTGVLERRDGAWRIVQMHFSFAQARDPVSIAVQTSGPFNVRTYLVWDDKAGEAALIDPGSAVDELLATLDTRGLKLKYVLLTHGHQDHLASLAAVRARFPGALLGYSGQEREDLTAYSGWRTLFGAASVAEWDKDARSRVVMDCDFSKVPAPDLALEDPQALRLGSLSIQLLLTPGHSRGSATFSVGWHLFPGDLILYHETGFMDYPLASREQTVASIQKLYAAFPDETAIHSGHGEDSTIGTEKRQNRTVRATGVTWGH